jgi:rRNA maturation endonuclease Nob1
LATLTVNSASDDVLWAQPVIGKARNKVNAVSDEALEKVRRVKYKEADDYLNAQKAIYDAKQAAIEMENEWLQLVLQSLYEA